MSIPAQFNCATTAEPLNHLNSLNSSPHAPFSAIGVSRADAVEEEHADYFLRWLSSGGNASMAYMANYTDLRLDPRKLHPGTKSIISAALNYYPSQHLSPSQYQFAYYAYGKDYHEVMRQYLTQLAQTLGIEGRICVDTAPVLERYWAWKAGLGWIGRNHNLIIPGKGSFVVLGEILTDAEFDTYDTPMPSHCGNCKACTSQCQALMHSAENQSLPFPAEQCHSYQTIENKYTEPLRTTQNHPEYSVSNLQSHYIYGCDCCQLVCPHNKNIPSTQIPEFQPSEQFLSMPPTDWHNLTQEQYKALFRHSAVKRAKYEKIISNISMANN